MITAHPPAGWLLTSGLRRRLELAPMWAGLAGAVFPDVDLLYFYFVDHRRTLHHRYWTHLPLFWLAVTIAATPMLLRFRRTVGAQAAAVFLANVFLHLLLDWPMGKIYFLAPLSWHAYGVFEVPAVLGPSMWNFLIHWTALFELAIWLAAVAVFVRTRRVTESAPTDVRCALARPPGGIP